MTLQSNNNGYHLEENTRELLDFSFSAVYNNFLRPAAA